MKSFNKLTPAQIELLAKLSEEAGEVVQAIGKILRRGFDRKNPHKGGPTNRRHLEIELGDLHAAENALVTLGELKLRRIEDACREKTKTAKKWLYHQDRRYIVI